MDIKAALEELKKNNHALYAQVIERLKTESKKPARQATPRTPREPVECTTYATVTKRYTCAHCGHTWDTTYHLSKGDEVNWTNNGKVGHMVVVRVMKEPLVIVADAMLCDHCPAFITALSRETLEDAYLTMLRETTMERLSMRAKKGGRS